MRNGLIAFLLVQMAIAAAAIVIIVYICEGLAGLR